MDVTVLHLFLELENRYKLYRLVLEIDNVGIWEIEIFELGEEKMDRDVDPSDFCKIVNYTCM